MAHHNLDAGRLSAARAAAERLPELHAYVVLQHGHIVDELYAGTYTAASKAHVRSITKSVTSALAGIAIEQGRWKGSMCRSHGVCRSTPGRRTTIESST